MSDRAGKFFLKQRGKKDTYYICWYDATTRQTSGVSCRTSDLQVATTALFKHALLHDKPQAVTDDSLAAVLARYYNDYAKQLASAASCKIAIRDVLAFWDDPNVSTLDRREQLRFVASQRADGLSDWTIQNKLGRVWAAMNWAKRDNAQLVVPDMITSADWRPILPNRELVYTPEELGRLFTAAAAHEHWWRFMVLAVGTAGREAAIRELTWPQVDMRVGRIALNPEGRRQTKKRRATVPVGPTLASELESWARDGETVITRDGQPMLSREFWVSLTKNAGLEDGGPNTIRHTVRTWLAEQGVPDSDADMFMGHKGAGSATGARYTHRRPDYLASVKVSLEDLYAAIRPHVKARGLRVKRVSDEATSVIQLFDSLNDEAQQAESGSDITIIEKSGT